jgi:hypothetical protein
VNQKQVALLAVLASAALWGCGISQEYAAQQNLDQSEAVYERCVATNGSGSTDCDSARQDYDSSQQTYDQTSNAVRAEPSIFSPRQSAFGTQ